MSTLWAYFSETPCLWSWYKESLTYTRLSFQSNTKVKLDSTFSSWLKILLGVPQGLLFPRFITFQCFLKWHVMVRWKNWHLQFCWRQHHIQLRQISKRCYKESQSDLKIALKWFKDNQTMANPGKFQFMILSKNTINQSIKSAKLLIVNKLNSRIHINNICKVASVEIKGLGRVTNRLNLSQAKILYNYFILPQFNYCCLIWMICSKTLQNKIN